MSMKNLNEQLNITGAEFIGSDFNIDLYKITTWNAAQEFVKYNDNNVKAGEAWFQNQHTFEANNSIYGKSNTVQPQTIKGYYYIVIATSTKTDIQVDIDEIATDLNGKADTDLTNITNQAKILMSGMPMPINRFIDLTIGASGATYTAPANGWFWITYEASNNATGGWAVFINMNNGIIAKSWSIYSFGTSILLPIEKGEVMQMLWGGNPFVTNVWFRFYYAQGSESEAS